MIKKSVAKVLCLSLTLMTASAQAMSLDWSGGYRFEWTEVDKPSLGSPSERKAYGLNYLYLSPKIIAADGVNVISRFDILSNSAYPNSQLGDIWGMNPAGTADQDVRTGNQGVVGVNVSQLYLSVNQEYGALRLGRAPFEFGTGMKYSAGTGMFDHWYDTRDLAAYKIVVGDWFFMPMLSRQQSKGFGQGGTISSLGFQLQYENEENKSLIAIFQETTNGVSQALGYTPQQIEAYGGAGATADGDMKIQRTNFVLARGFDSFEFRLEAGFESGATGVRKGTSDVELSGYGIATEFLLPRKESKWEWSLKAGMATGNDDSATDFGGYSFNRNYDVAMLLFNHRLGSADLLGTNVQKNSGIPFGDSADDEAISNAMYFAPAVTYAWNEKLDLRNTIIYAQLMKENVATSKDLGLEWDIELIYKPSARVQWVNQLGLLFPGDAWKVNGAANDFTFGFASKAAISF